MHEHDIVEKNDLISKIEDIVGVGNFAQCEGYSGRGMFGRKSTVAISCDDHPASTRGQQLIGLGLSYDNLGLQYVYYTRD